MRASILTALPDIPEIGPGDDLAALLLAALSKLGGERPSHEVLVVTQKVVSKAEDRYVYLNTVQVSRRAAELAALTRKDPGVVELVLRESVEVLRAKVDVLIVRHRLGFAMANAGIDRSNVAGKDRVLLLPLDPNGSATQLCDQIAKRSGRQLGIIIADSFGRPWRRGVTHVALGAAGLPALLDRRDELDQQRAQARDHRSCLRRPAGLGCRAHHGRRCGGLAPC